MIREEALCVEAGTGLVHGVQWLPSPNCDSRPPGAGIELVVVHGISLPPGAFGGPWVQALFENRLPPDQHPYFREIEGLRVSAHVFVRRDGSLQQFVPFHLRAWHAGVSTHRFRPACNDYSVGIELEGADEVPYQDAQYACLARLVAALCRTYASLDPAAVVGHSDVAPGRKTDPGPAFDWARAHAGIRAALAAGARP